MRKKQSLKERMYRNFLSREELQLFNRIEDIYTEKSFSCKKDIYEKYSKYEYIQKWNMIEIYNNEDTRNIFLRDEEILIIEKIFNKLSKIEYMKNTSLKEGHALKSTFNNLDDISTKMSNLEILKKVINILDSELSFLNFQLCHYRELEYDKSIFNGIYKHEM